MFIYHCYKAKNWFVYSCPRRVILISRSRSLLRKRTEAISYINHGKIIQIKQFEVYGNVVKRKKPTLKYITPVLERIVDSRYKIIRDYTTEYDLRGVILRNWEEKILVDVGFFE